MLDHLDLLNTDKFESCFSELGGQYTEFSDRSCRHEVSITDCDENWRQVQRLSDVGYITSFQKKSSKEFYPVKSDDKIISKIEAIN